MNSHDFPVSHCPGSVPSSASTTALSLPVVTRVREGQPGGVDKRVGKDKHKESRHHPRVAFDDGDGGPRTSWCLWPLTQHQSKKSV